MEIVLHPHARERLRERGVSEDEVKATIEEGERVPEKFGRTGFRRYFHYGSLWKGTHYETKQVEVIAVEEEGQWLVITVVARYF